LPSVSLSPNPRYFEKASCGIGGGSTFTENEHEAECPAVSVALQVTGVDPTANADPDVCEQLVVTGGLPPLEVGAANVTTALFAPSAARDETSGGQTIASGGVGEIGVLPEQPSHSITPVPTIEPLTNGARRTRDTHIRGTLHCTPSASAGLPG